MLMKVSEVIPTFFRDMSYSPREVVKLVLNSHTNALKMVFFTENVSKTGAGIAEDHITLGICSLVEGRYPDAECFILDDELVQTMMDYQRDYKEWMGRARAASFEKRYDDSTAYWNQAWAIKQELADLYNVIIDGKQLRYAPRAFVEF